MDSELEKEYKMTKEEIARYKKVPIELCFQDFQDGWMSIEEPFIKFKKTDDRDAIKKVLEIMYFNKDLLQMMIKKIEKHCTKPRDDTELINTCKPLFAGHGVKFKKGVEVIEDKKHNFGEEDINKLMQYIDSLPSEGNTEDKDDTPPDFLKMYEDAQQEKTI